MIFQRDKLTLHGIVADMPGAPPAQAYGYTDYTRAYY